jgi:hypothetical protein
MPNGTPGPDPLFKELEGICVQFKVLEVLAFINWILRASYLRC